jgi:hypothetical protein
MSINSDLYSLQFNNSTWLTGNYYQAEILFENKDSQAKRKTTVLQNRAHPSQQKFFEFLGTQNLCSLFHIFKFTHTPVGAPNCVCTVGFQLLSILSCHSKSSWNAHAAQLIREFLQAACSTSGRTTLSAYSLKADDYPAKLLFVASANMRMPSECFLYVIQDMHKLQGIQNLQFTGADQDFVQEMVKRVYPVLPATAS